MRSKGYSQSISVIASAFFGTAVRNFDEFHENLSLMAAQGTTPSSNHEFLATLAAIAFFLLLFHVIHGINCYDAWAGSLPDGKSNGVKLGVWTRVVSVITQPVAALLFPFWIFHAIASPSKSENLPHIGISEVTIVWVGMLGAFTVWDWLMFLHAPRDSADPGMHKAIANWLMCDAWALACFLAVLICMASFGVVPAWWLFVWFIITAVGYVVLDYIANHDYFFGAA